MKQKHTITIKMKPYLRDYLIGLYGDPVRFDSRSKYNELIMELVTRPPEGWTPGVDSQIKKMGIRAAKLRDELARMASSDEYGAAFNRKSRQLANINRHIEEMSRSTVTVQLPYNNKKDIRSYYYMSMNSQDIIQQRIHSVFCAELFYFINKCVNNNNKDYHRLNIKQSIVLFLEKHSIHPDSVTVDTIKKQYYRYRKSMSCVDIKKIISL